MILSFSSGIFYNRVLEGQYYLDDGTIKEEPESPSFDVSPGAMVNFSWKCSHFTQVGLSVGASVSPFDGKTRYMVGPNVIFGKYRGIQIQIYPKTSIEPKYGYFYLKNKVSVSFQSLLVQPS